VGRAATLGLWHAPQCRDWPDGVPAVVDVYALDESLRAIRAGRAVFYLLLDHDAGRLIASSDDDCLALRRIGTWLLLEVSPCNPAGRAALAVIEASGRRELSVGLHTSRVRKRYASGALAGVRITEGAVGEVSLVRHAACPGCRLSPYDWRAFRKACSKR
jgi:hypothetical protein